MKEISNSIIKNESSNINANDDKGANKNEYGCYAIRITTKKWKLIPFDHIYYVKALGAYTEFVVAEPNGKPSKYVLVKHLKRVKKELDELSPGRFWKCHKSYVVNKTMISTVKLTGRTAILSFTNPHIEEIPVSRSGVVHLREMKLIL